MTSSFTFVSHDHDLDQGTFLFHFRLNVEGKNLEFVERLIIDSSIIKHKTDVTPILNNLLLMIGISYWKTYCPVDIHVEPFSLTQKQAEFWNTVYTKGLGEFFYRNQIDFRRLVHFPFDSSQKKSETHSLIAYEVENKALVPLGGGKDSLVTAELLKAQARPFTFLTIDPRPIHQMLADRVGVPLITVKREIDPALMELNRTPGVYNGHIPITGVRAFIDILVAALVGYSSVIISNEESANYGNVTYLGESMNHQWSKSVEFEKLFGSYLRSFITSSITYASMLRDYTEIEIAEMFSRYPQYFDVFMSCNKNFKITVDTKIPTWCGKCPKCAFVFLLLSAYIPKDTLVGIFRKNLYEDTSLLPVFRELLGLVGFKPFECVGTPEESRLAFAKVMQQPGYANAPVVSALRKEL